jgi:rubrerythrin
MVNATRFETGRTLRDPGAVAREARRLVGFERSYRCDGCGHEHRTWTRLSECPDCGTAYVAAVIHRAALA